ncbi:MAG: PRC-barrel domain-containing protein [Clostridia bacterium]|nr:PRC-barrel domain-containing protein [Clostridia bacterium]
MKKGRTVIGLAVLEEKEGHRLGKVIDVLYSGDEGKILGIMVETEGISLPEMRFIQFPTIIKLTEEAVFVEGKDALLAPQCLKNNEETSYSAALLSGQHIYSELGKEKGTIKDVLLDFTLGKVEGYQISTGLISDLISGRNVIPVGNVITMGKDMIIVKDEV